MKSIISNFFLLFAKIIVHRTSKDLMKISIIRRNKIVCYIKFYYIFITNPEICNDSFLSTVKKYTEIPELTSEIVHEFIDRIIVHEQKAVVKEYRKSRLSITISEYLTVQRSMYIWKKRYNTELLYRYPKSKKYPYEIPT